MSRGSTGSAQWKQALWLIAARRWDHRDDALLLTARPIAEAYELEGDGYMADEDWDAAYDAYFTALRLDPQRAFARRKAEQARDKRLGLEQPEDPISKLIRQVKVYTGQWLGES